MPIPVAQPCMVFFPLAEPAVVHHEALDSDACSFFRQGLLSGLIDVETCRLIGVVQDGPQTPMWSLRDHGIKLEPVQEPRRATYARVRISAVELRSLQG